MEKTFDFSDLFVLDLANNHQGSVEHGKTVIRNAAKVVKKHGVKAAIKFQFRQLKTFIHPSHKDASDNKHIPRFLSTELSLPQYQELLDEVRKHNLLSMCTPFDEASVDAIAEMGFDIIKIASCSAADWPLIEKVASKGIPVIFSTGGQELIQIDELVSFFDHKCADYAIMHCVSIYPTPLDEMNLANIAMLRQRYPKRIIGWSTHEDPDDCTPIQVSYAYGARMFERHIGHETDNIKLNAYSSREDQLDNWISAYKRSILMSGSYSRKPASPIEADALKGLKRGVFAKRQLKKDTVLSAEDVFFAMPCEGEQLDSGLFKPGIKLKRALKVNEIITQSDVEAPQPPKAMALKKAIYEVKAMLNKANIVLGPEFEVEYSHHNGIENFTKTGVVIINCINREYCKKVLVQLPNQSHPFHFHKRKEETFQVLWGEMYSEIDGRVQKLLPGDTALVLPGVWHRFWTETGVIFEEVSTTHFNNDSIYKDPKINEKKREERKTIVDHWGRFQLTDG
ncbi:N-acetylneuraminate synthase family protein [Kiloniella sp. EL199]|uniref:N-acetylneuraminate synthase family protein n=1 Tax=Kiloniella sp. EL199 TaxID=2107581 RepID=UPI000EA0546C|nr:N-acetylneuraminate synthase family protein [Kiloniella sp. EL199]